MQNQGVCLKRYLLLFLPFSVLNLSGCRSIPEQAVDAFQGDSSPVQEENSYQKIVAHSVDQNMNSITIQPKHLLIYYAADWCPYCVDYETTERTIICSHLLLRVITLSPTYPLKREKQVGSWICSGSIDSTFQVLCSSIKRVSFSRPQIMRSEMSMSVIDRCTIYRVL